jgi:hypothetical protein
MSFLSFSNERPLLVSECDERIDARGTASGQKARDYTDKGQQCDRKCNRDWIHGRDSIQLALNKTPKAPYRWKGDRNQEPLACATIKPCAASKKVIRAL